MLHWKPKSRHCDALDLAATWPWAAPFGGFPVSELAQSCCPEAGEQSVQRMGRNPRDEWESRLPAKRTHQEND
jgi:hypothetical protein